MLEQWFQVLRFKQNVRLLAVEASGVSSHRAVAIIELHDISPDAHGQRLPRVTNGSLITLASQVDPPFAIWSHQTKKSIHIGTLIQRREGLLFLGQHDTRDLPMGTALPLLVGESQPVFVLLSKVRVVPERAALEEARLHPANQVLHRALLIGAAAVAGLRLKVQLLGEFCKDRVPNRLVVFVSPDRNCLHVVEDKDPGDPAKILASL